MGTREAAAMDDLAERARAATKEYVAASKTVGDLMGIGHDITGGQPPPVTPMSRETLAEWDAAEAREAKARKEWRDAMAAWSESRRR
jgi:hypothetical protein